MNWKDVVGYEGYYQVSETGLVISLDRYDSLGRFRKGVIKSQIVQNSGYLIVNFRLKGKQKNFLIHRLVAEAFISNPETKKYVNHKDGDKLNNHVDNLEWVTASENMKHANDLGLANIVNRKVVKVTNNKDINLMFKSQYEVSQYFGFTDDWCHQRVLRNGTKFTYGEFTLEVL
jgi:hypothetical protein